MRILKFGSLGLLILFIIASIGGFIYQSAGLSSDASRYPPPGQLVDIGTHRLHLDCSGSGAPTVLLDAGAGGWSIHWFGVRPELERHTTVCAFDRSGLGWSEPSNAYDGHALAQELHALIKTAGIGPVVYTGHSLGANLAQIHYDLFPEDVVGLVLLDPGRPVDMLEDFEGSRDDAIGLDACGWQCAVASLATRLGLVRFMTKDVGIKTLGPERQALYHAGLAAANATETLIAYLEFLPKTAHQLLAIETFGDTPLEILYSGDTRKPEGAETPHDVAEWHRAVMQDMAALAAKSSRGAGPEVLPGATHQSMVVEPQYTSHVAESILAMVLDLRG